MSAALSPICGVLRNTSLVDFPGRIAGVFFFSGCNFRCGFCHNAASLGVHQPGMPWERLERICRDLRADWADGVVLSGGEPTLEPALPACIGFFKDRGFAVKLDTNGSNPDVVEPLLPLLDYVAMDLKCGPERYPAVAGFADVARIERSVRLLREQAVACEFRTTVLPGIHTQEEIRRIGVAFGRLPFYALQPFVARDDLPDPALRTAPSPSAEQLRLLSREAERFADRVVVRGAVNV